MMIVNPKPAALGMLVAALVWAGAAGAETLTGTAVKISDGDTFRLQTQDKCTQRKNCVNGMQVYRVRLANIDAPEHDQPYGQEASEGLTKMLPNQREVTVKVRNTDRYGRIVGEVYVGSLYVNAEQVKAGNAWVYTQYNSDPDMVTYEKAARSAKKGLWAQPAGQLTPPWEWRHSQREE